MNEKIKISFLLSFTLFIFSCSENSNPTSPGADFLTEPIFLQQWNIASQAAPLSQVAGITLDSSANVFVCDNGNNRIDKFDSNGNYLLGWGSTGSGSGQFNGPSGIAWANNTVYVSDSGNGRVLTFDPNGNAITVIGSLGSGVSQLSNPQGLAIDSGGNIYVADSGNNRIEVFHPGGAAPTTWGVAGSGPASFNSPTGITLDSSNDVYVADTLNNQIQKFTASGGYLNSWGGFGTGTGQFRSPEGLAFDSSGILYVTDTANGRIQEFDVNGTFITQWGGLGNNLGQFQVPNWIAVTPSPNYFYISDAGPNVVKKFGPAAPYSIFPNPVMPSQKLTISFNSASFIGYLIRITDFDGNVVFSNQGQAVAGDNAVQWDGTFNGSRVQAGVYLLDFTLGHSEVEQKISIVN